MVIGRSVVPRLAQSQLPCGHSRSVTTVFAHGVSIRLPAIHPRSLVSLGPSTSPDLLGRDPPALCRAAHLMIRCQFQNHLIHEFPHPYSLITVRTVYLRLPRLAPPSPYYYCHWSCSLSNSFSYVTVNLAIWISQGFLMKFMAFNEIQIFLFKFSLPTVPPSDCSDP